jgi:esterase/lipase/1-acyl-sn-glycerol-3-phosphate acyltransferase
MNRFAFLTTGLAIKAIYNLSKARMNVHGKENLPQTRGSIIFVVNHFTRFETFFLPYQISKLTRAPVWSLADHNLFKGSFGGFLENVGAVSTRNPHRDLLIVKSLLTGEAVWIIFPEGRMVKNKKIIEKGRFMISYAGGKHPPHTGAATLALRTEFYRQRLRTLSETAPDETKRLQDLFQIDTIEPVLENNTYIVPVNVTYYPVRAQENILSNLAVNLVDDIPDRMVEELMTEGTMLLSGVEVDIRIGEPLEVRKFMKSSLIDQDISTLREINFDDLLPSRREMRKAALNIMQRYMSAIYSMTTVNHDHLFASMLKQIPYKKIDENDLRRKVYFTTTRNLEKMGVHLHPGLENNQIHLITDDAVDKFKDFISLAIEKDIIKQHGNVIVKNSSSFSDAFDFHRARIDNPVWVMANEVEPLENLQQCIRRISWLPDFWLRRKVAQHLMKESFLEFEEDYQTFYTEGESKTKDVGKPFLITGKSRVMGLVLVHGYMAAPLEVKELAIYLGRKGFWVYVPRLKGHGTSPDDLANRAYMDWIASVDMGYAIISSLCKNVVVGGFSTGAGLALDMAARFNDVKGVFAVCPPLRLQDLSSKFVPAVDTWNRFMEMFHLDGAKKEFVENRPENPHINYCRNPISGVRELERLMDAVEPKLPAINVPALVVQAHGDPVVDPRGSKRIFEQLGSKDKEYILFNFQRHGILLGQGSQKVHRAIGDFIAELAERKSF